MTRRKVKTFLMQLIERDHPGQSIEQILLNAYCEHGSEREAAQALGITQQSFNAWKFRLGLDNAMRVEHMRRSAGTQPEES